MLGRNKLFLLLILNWLIFPLYSQDAGEVEIEDIYVSDHTFAFYVNTDGVGVGYQRGWHTQFADKHVLDISFLYSNHIKAVRGTNFSYEGARAYSYGKLYDLFFLRTGYTYQKTVFKKPYWGGVSIDFNLSTGFTLGIGLPTYLEIAYYAPGGYDIIRVTERYNPEIHDLTNIIGGAPFYERFHKLAFRPGVFGKAGLVFDFSQRRDRIRAFAVGVQLDSLFPPLQQMAFNAPTPVYLGGYIAYQFGRKKQLYE
ncbi:MAG TPA: hypothetical protein PLH70_06265 [Bacteroidales bacterium]|mgnify:CR=1 FL=1|nr:hypothetical protein [Bacteroidales bacterium]HOH22514.1 hypothetical protein [Bacteroidales bacterium]HPB57830.1 hypothetical protein [Bacteroidales bacterium]HPZ02982.1 hypothetical protein [Bacteroidales bacterium]HQB75386.1 hypothetical protein [Bacteroidales bacterium]